MVPNRATHYICIFWVQNIKLSPIIYLQGTTCVDAFRGAFLLKPHYPLYGQTTMNWAHLKENYGFRYSESFPLTNAVSKLYILIQFNTEPFNCQPHKMDKHTQTIRGQKPTNCLSVFVCFVGLALKGLRLCQYDLPNFVTTEQCQSFFFFFLPKLQLVSLFCTFSLAR